jgi:hypothetical protein
MMKGSRRSLVLGCLGGLLLLGVLAAVTVVLLVNRIPEVSQQLPPDATPLLVNLTAPLDGSKLLLDTPAAVYAEAVGDRPVTAFELWVDGILVQVRSIPSGAGQTLFSASWAWTPTETGEHVLFARATDADGKVANSNVVRVQVPAREAYPLSVSEPGPGEDEGSPPPPAPLPDPGVLPPEMQPEPGEPPPSAPPAPGWSGSIQPAPGSPPDKMRFWWASQAGGASAQPQPPEIGIGVDGCDVWLYITDRATEEEGFFIYRLDPGSGAFKRIATLDRYDGSGPFAYVDQGLYGKFAYYVASFNTASESPSQVTQLVEVNASQCVLLENSGLQLVGGKITTPDPVDKLYCYMSFDRGPWTRVPPGANTFIYPTGGEFDVSEYINLLTTPPPQTDVSLALECWGWRGDSLIELGRIEQTIGPSQFNSPVVIGGANFSLAGHMAIQVLGGSGSVPSAYIAPPLGLRVTTDAGVCEQLSQDLGKTLAMLLCQGAIDAGDMILAWQWSPTSGCWPGGTCKYDVEDIDGYRIYVHTLGQQPTLVRSVTNPQQKVVGIPPQPTTMLAPPCFTVRAFKGYLESEDSNCVQPIATQAKVTLDGQDDIWEASFSKDGGPHFSYWGEKVFGGRKSVRAGFYHDDSDSKCRAMFYRGVIHFDLAAVKGPVTGATLSAEFAGRTCRGKDGCSLAQTVNCGTFLMADGADFAGPGVPLTAGVDVTAPVRAAQARGDTVVGFCLRGWDETMAPMCDDNACYVEYNRNFRLDVSYNPAPGP